MSVYTQEKTRL